MPPVDGVLSRSAFLARFERNAPPLKKIETPAGGRYLYDTGTNKILRPGDAVFDFFDQQGAEGAWPKGRIGGAPDEVVDDLYDTYCRLGCFDPTPFDIVTFSDDEIDRAIRKLRDTGPDILVLNLTERCNLRCAYCAFSGAYTHSRTHAERAMTRATALRAINWYLAFDRPSYGFAFYGGEPMLALKVLKDLVAHTREQTGKPTKFNLTTNATLLTKPVVAWCVANDITLTISLDGPEPVHDRYRRTRKDGATFAIVFAAIEQIHRDHPDYFRDHILFNLVLAPPYRLDEIRHFVSDNADLFPDGKLQISPVSGHPQEIAHALGLDRSAIREGATGFATARQAFDTDLGRAGRSDAFLHSLLGRGMLAIHKRDDHKLTGRSPSHGQCLPGIRKCFVDTDGTLYMCEKVQAYPIGDVFAGFNETRIQDFLVRYSDFLAEACKGCWAIRLCQKCFNSIREGEELSPQRLEQFCDTSRRGLSETLTRYCAIREARDSAFDWADDIELV